MVSWPHCSILFKLYFWSRQVGLHGTFLIWKHICIWRRHCIKLVYMALFWKNTKGQKENSFFVFIWFPIKTLVRNTLHYGLKTALKCKITVLNMWFKPQLIAVNYEDSAINRDLKNLSFDSPSVYVYVCMHVCLYICMYVCMYVCICMYVCMYIYVYICVCVCMCVYVYICIYMCVCVCMYMCIYVYIYVCVCVCMYVCMYIYILCMFVCMYIHVYL